MLWVEVCEVTEITKPTLTQHRGVGGHAQAGQTMTGHPLPAVKGPVLRTFPPTLLQPKLGGGQLWGARNLPFDHQWDLTILSIP